MKNGDTVAVSGARGEVIAEIVDVRLTEDLPCLPGIGIAGLLGPVYLAQDYVRIAMLKYRFFDTPEGRDVVFAAVETKNGTWQDLKGQELQITESRPVQ